MDRRYVLRRVAGLVPAVAAILFVTFLVIHLVPGDPVAAMVGEDASPAQVELIRRTYGFDRPLFTQFWTYAGNVLTGDLGVSYMVGEPVRSVIADRLPATLLLTGSALVVSVLGGIALGALAARRPFGFADMGLNTAALVGYALPAFWLAQLAVMFLALKLQLFPLSGMTDARTAYAGWAHVSDVAYHLILPAAVLAASEVALITRITRAGLLQQLGTAFVKTAEGKGVEGGRVLMRHALPNALLPVVTIIGSRMGFLFSGAVLVEQVFGWPGLGSLSIQAAQREDRPLVLGMVLLVSFAVVIANLVTDLVYARIDPRVRYN